MDSLSAPTRSGMTPIDSEEVAAAVLRRRPEMLSAGELIYLLSRERQSRVMATRARDPAIKHIHMALAAAYARRAREPDDGNHTASA